jgi:uncharacterized membrane protein
MRRWRYPGQENDMEFTSGRGVLDKVIDRIEGSNGVARLTAKASETIEPLVPRSAASLLSAGGHSLHPPLTDLPLGCWLSATVLDLLDPGEDGASRQTASTLIGVGLLGAVPTAITGWVDWSNLGSADRRVATVHAVGNQVAIVLFIGSLVSRRRKRQQLGTRLALLGNAVALGAGFLGGYLALTRGTADRS